MKNFVQSSTFKVCMLHKKQKDNNMTMIFWIPHLRLEIDPEDAA